MVRLNELFEGLRTAYSGWERGFLKKLGRFGVWYQGRIDFRLGQPDWKRLNRIWIWITILAFVVGWSLAGFYYQYQCNKNIILNFYPEYACDFGLEECSEGANFITSNLSVEDIPLLGREREVGVT